MMDLCSLLLAALLSLLGHEDYATREKASEALARAGLAAEPVLLVGSRCPDAEVKARCRALLARLARERLDADLASLRAGLAGKGYDAWPWIDSLPPENRPWAVSHYLACSTAPVRGAPDWPEYREATRLWVQDSLAAGEPKAVLEALLAEMVERERERCTVQTGWRFAGKK